MSEDSESRTKAIRHLNDRFRQTFAGGRIVVTAGVRALGARRLPGLLSKVRKFDAFDQDNDPRHEHDFGVFVDDWDRFFWKIDYYDPSMTYHSDDASDANKTIRVLTLMLAEEY